MRNIGNGTFVNNCRIALLLLSITSFIHSPVHAQPMLETGGQKMPDTWIDKYTHNKIIPLTRKPGDNNNFYFHNNPFLVQKGAEGDRMVFYSSDPKGHQVYTVNLRNFNVDQVTAQHSPMNGEIVGHKIMKYITRSKTVCFLLTQIQKKHG